jgi:hypothetical protein
MILCESAYFVSLMFCVLDNNIRNFMCVLSGAGFQFEEFWLSPKVGINQIWGWIIQPGGRIICPPFEISGIWLRTWIGVTQIWGRIIRPGGRIIRPGGRIIRPLRVFRKMAKDLTQHQPDTRPDNPAMAQIIRHPSKLQNFG